MKIISLMLSIALVGFSIWDSNWLALGGWGLVLLHNIKEWEND